MTRRKMREQIFKILFQIDFHPKEEWDSRLKCPEYEDGQLSEEDSSYIEHKVFAVASKLTELDGSINAVAKGWKTMRMAKVDLTLLRLAVYEIKFDDDIPTGVAINEAVELAKKYGTDDSSSFVNGILAKIA